MSVMLADLHHGPTAGRQGLLSAAIDTMGMVADPDSLFETTRRLQAALAAVGPSLAVANLGCLRQLCLYPDSRILMVSAHDEPSVRRVVQDAGEDKMALARNAATDLLPAVNDVPEQGRHHAPTMSAPS